MLTGDEYICNEGVNIKCEQCNWKAEDMWDDNPDGFSLVENGYWLCDDCNTGTN